ncbi:uncharacterized protein YbjQ (UPF0145 family) [Salinibacter ruber]|uniref:YbjQ family protein n=1 Tax=Salinibacter ruber TaxID=146919 RepID=UPI0021673F41|nr:YbjQ family protein [Salinibacter ruber]MCS4191262.1 uncharacterized protein YbjQ (UPF0145 family) [Salinibacter ruber]
MAYGPAQDIITSATPRLEGQEVQEYLGPVSSHLVAGTNIFSDIAASFSDLFGGRSKSYRKQLEKINEEVIGQLKEKAANRGANALVGLQIDNDQISGQNKEMFMVTASATAVRVESRSEPSPKREAEKEEPITANEMNVEEKTVRLRRKHENGTLQLSDENWRFLIENRVSDFAGIAQDTVTGSLEASGVTPRQRTHLNNGPDYFLSLSDKKAKEHLYEMTAHDNLEVADWAIGVLEEGNMLDLSQVEALLGEDFYSGQKPALEILTRVDKSYYEQSDIPRLEALKLQIERSFGKRAEVFEVEKSGTFSSGTEKVWQIKEGARNSMDRDYCSETGLDMYGFGKTETKPEEAIQALETKVSALHRRFSSS